MKDSSGIDVTTLRWDNKCHLCGMVIPAGEKAAWYPESIWRHSTQRVRTRTVHDNVLRADVTIRKPIIKPARMSGYVTHYHTPCASEYTIKAVYDSTSKLVTVTAYSADDALMVVHKRLSSNAQKRSVPSAYVVYQGNILVTTEVAGVVQRKIHCQAVMGGRSCTRSIPASSDESRSTVSESGWRY